jgi:hypothetical protein
VNKKICTLKTLDFALILQLIDARAQGGHRIVASVNISPPNAYCRAIGDKCHDSKTIPGDFCLRGALNRQEFKTLGKEAAAVSRSWA